MPQSNKSPRSTLRSEPRAPAAAVSTVMFDHELVLELKLVGQLLRALLVLSPDGHHTTRHIVKGSIYCIASQPII